MAGTGFLDAGTTIGATGWVLTLIAKAIGLLVMGAVTHRLTLAHSLRWNQIGAVSLALLMLARGTGHSPEATACPLAIAKGNAREST